METKDVLNLLAIIIIPIAKFSFIENLNSLDGISHKYIQTIAVINVATAILSMFLNIATKIPFKTDPITIMAIICFKYKFCFFSDL